MKIVVVGDMSFNCYYDRLLNRLGPDYPFRHVLPLWRDADLRLGNLESPPTSQPRATPSKFTLRGSPRSVESLAQAGFDCLCVANNHMMDFGAEGLGEACSRITKAGIPVVGAGRNEKEAYAPVILEVRGQKVGILAFCDVIQVSPLYAQGNGAGVAGWEPNVNLSRIRELRQHVDWLIVHMHWGIELAQLPSPQQREWARALVSAGADLILGHHPHVLQPVEVIDGAVVAYSLGNFLFSEAYWRGRNNSNEKFASKMRPHPLTRQTGWLEVVLHRGEPIECQLWPALLTKQLDVIPDNSSRWSASSKDFSRLVSSPDYAAMFEAETHRAADRRDWEGAPGTVANRALVKLFHWRLLPWVGAEV